MYESTTIVKLNYYYIVYSIDNIDGLIDKKI